MSDDVIQKTKVGDIEFTQIKDIPPNIAEELERLHDILKESIGEKVVSQAGDLQGYIGRDEKMFNWAQERIDNIHKLLFSPLMVVRDE